MSAAGPCRGARAILAAIVVAVPVASCVTSAPPPGAPKVVTGYVVPPFGLHEECARLTPGDRLEFTFSSNEPVDFNLHYHDAGAVVMPLTREKVLEDWGFFAPPFAHDYCLTWESGAAGARIDYRMHVRRGAP
jgi:hypothetical protein